MAEGPPESIGGRADAAAQIRFHLPEGVRPEDLPVAAERVDDGIVLISTATPTAAMGDLARWAAGRGGELEGLTVLRPSLEDIYLSLTEPADGTVE